MPDGRRRRGERVKETRVQERASHVMPVDKVCPQCGGDLYADYVNVALVCLKCGYQEPPLSAARRAAGAPAKQPRRADLGLPERAGLAARPSDAGSVQREGPPDSRDVEISWIEHHRAEIRQRYAGQWIVVEGDSLVAHHRDLQEAVDRASRRGIRYPFVLFIRRKRHEDAYEVA